MSFYILISYTTIESEHKSDFELLKDTPSITLMGELLDVYCDTYIYKIGFMSL